LGDQTYDTGSYGDVLQLGMSLDHKAADGTSTNGTAATYRGPAIVSSKSFYLSEGDEVSFDWRSLYLNDQYDVFGYLARVDATDVDQHITILDAQGDDSSNPNDFTTGWNSVTKAIPAGMAGEYRFVFVGGSWDTHAGKQVGSLFWLDNIKVELASGLAPIVFAGVGFDGAGFTNDEASLKAAQQVFDREAKHETGFATTTALIPMPQSWVGKMMAPMTRNRASFNL